MFHQAAKLTDPQLLGTVAQVIALARRQMLHTKLFISGCCVTQFPEHTGNGGAALLHLPAIFQTGERAELEHRPVLFIQSNLLLDLLLLYAEQMIQV